MRENVFYHFPLSHEKHWQSMYFPTVARVIQLLPALGPFMSLGARPTFCLYIYLERKNVSFYNIFVIVQLPSCLRLFVTLWTAACRAHCHSPSGLTVILSLSHMSHWHLLHIMWDIHWERVEVCDRFTSVSTCIWFQHIAVCFSLLHVPSYLKHSEFWFPLTW